MSLTSELKDRELAHGVYNATVPQVTNLSAAFQVVQPTDAEALQPPVAAGTRVARGTLKAAFDYRLRYAFSDNRALPETMEHGIAGAFRLAGPAAGAAVRRAGDDLGYLLGELGATVRLDATTGRRIVAQLAAAGSG